MAPDPPVSSGAARSAGSISLSFGHTPTRSKTHDNSQLSGGRLIRAPADSDDELEHPSRSHRTASYRVPDSDSDDSDGEEVDSAPSAAWLNAHHTPELDVLRWFQEEQKARYLATSQRTLCALQRQLMEVDLETAQELDEWDRHTKMKQDEMLVAERQRLQQRDRERELRLQELSKSQQQTAQIQQQQLQKVQAEAEAARKAKEAAERKAAEERKRKEEEERKKKQEQERIEQEKKQAEAAAKAAAEVAAKTEAEKKSAQAAKPAPSPPATRRVSSSGLCIADSAAEFDSRVSEHLKKMEAAAESFKKASGTQWRTLDKTVNKHVLQISATQQQVVRKSQELVSLMRGCSSEEMRAFVFVSLSSKLLKQCEVQVQQLPSFAFPLAMVTVNVAAEMPGLMDILLGLLHKVCVVAVPKYYVYKKGAESDVEYLKQMGYREVGDEGEQKMESTDLFIDRIKGYILYYAAVTQVEHHAHPHGLEHAWMFIARMLNSLPSNRITATVLDSFLKVAGYRMYRQFRNQFVKLLQYVMSHFLEELKHKKDSELSAVVSRINTYLSKQQYLQEPDGRRMPQQDESEYNRA